MLGLDPFKDRVRLQMDIGTRHHHESDIHRAFRELSDLTLLNTSEPMEDDPDWWGIRANLMAYDCILDKQPSAWQRRN